MSKPVLIATHKLDNGWTVRECEAVGKGVEVGIAVDGSLARFVVVIYRRPGAKTVNFAHFEGSTTAERALAVRAAKRRARSRDLPAGDTWSRYKDPRTGGWVYAVVIGSPIDEREAFDSIATQVEDEAFSSITLDMGVTA